LRSTQNSSSLNLVKPRAFHLRQIRLLVNDLVNVRVKIVVGWGEIFVA
jgi:hypothetical protein